MPSLEQVNTRNILEKGVIGQVGDDMSVLFTLRYIGTGTVTSVIVTTNTDITMTTSDGGTDEYTWAAYTTVGLLVDAINAGGIFEARLMDCLSTTATGADVVVTGTSAADSNGMYKVMSDTNNALFLAYRITADRNFGTNMKLKKGHRVHLQAILTNITAGGPDANALKVYECSTGGNSISYAAAENLVYQKTPANAANTSITWASGEGDICSSEGNELLVIVTDGASLTGNITVTGFIE
jgi:hypothetical protein